MAYSQVGSRTWVLTATLVTIATVVAVAVRFGLSPQAPAFCALAAAGVPLAFFDARTARLPNVVTLPAYPVSLALLGAAAPFLAGGTQPVRPRADRDGGRGGVLRRAPADLARGHRHGRSEAGRAARRLPGLARRDRVHGRAAGCVAARGGDRPRAAAGAPRRPQHADPVRYPAPAWCLACWKGCWPRCGRSSAPRCSSSTGVIRCSVASGALFQGASGLAGPGACALATMTGGGNGDGLRTWSSSRSARTATGMEAHR